MPFTEKSNFKKSSARNKIAMSLNPLKIYQRKKFRMAQKHHRKQRSKRPDNDRIAAKINNRRFRRLDCRRAGRLADETRHQSSDGVFEAEKNARNKKGNGSFGANLKII